jgi:hypothetical protein
MRQRKSVVQVNAIFGGVLRRGPGEDPGIYVKAAVCLLVLHGSNKYLYIPSTDAVIWRISFALNEVLLPGLFGNGVFAAVV